ncbi:hypothetical protein [Gloeobacter kilaueensis]|uniref:hypothetical protein n=1 Tax=Gloeobacter kilaueensis TaxID=1416614 RepID=UPI0016515BCF|nr:hypothetical protein [Gloeobacter kilaueensis]
MQLRSSSLLYRYGGRWSLLGSAGGLLLVLLWAGSGLGSRPPAITSAEVDSRLALLARQVLSEYERELERVAHRLDRLPHPHSKDPFVAPQALASAAAVPAIPVLSGPTTAPRLLPPPPMPLLAPGAGGEPETSLALVGVIEKNQRPALAFLRAGGQLQSATVGAVLADGWTVVGLAADRVILKRGEENRILTIGN